MPFGIHKHPNRSKQALSESSVAAQGNENPTSPRSASPYSGNDEARTSTSQPQIFDHQTNQRPDSQIYPAQAQGPPPPDHRVYQNPPDTQTPSRSQSTRFSSGASAYQQTQQLHQQHALQHQASGSADDLVLEARKAHRHGHVTPPQAPVIEQKKSKSLFDRMRSSTSRTSEQKTPTSPSHNSSSGLSRRLSKRHENVPAPVIKTTQQSSTFDQQRLDPQSARDSRTHLPSPQEGHEDNDIDPYLIRTDQEDIHISPHSATQEHNQLHTIRPIQNELDAGDYDDERQQYTGPSTQSHQGHHQLLDSANQNQYQYQQHQSHLQQHQAGSLGTTDPYRQQNPETVSQLSYDSPITDQREEQRPPSQSNGQSPTSYPPSRQDFTARSSSIQGPRPLSQYNPMAPPPGGAQQNRRSVDPKQIMQGSQGQAETRDGPPPNYSRQQFAGGQAAPPGLTTQTSSQGPNYRGGPPQREQYGPPGGGEQGRSTPPPVPADRADANDPYKELLTKYKKVKGLYFDKTAQVEQLQNTLANQRLSQSRTSLDDSEYASRFQRLDGAIINLAFNIRKDWRGVPTWLTPYCNQDAFKIGKQEMTGVGRACISKFLMDEIFNRIFHPGLEDELSRNLKVIERNIRKNSPALNNQEESDALTSKIVNWRLATLEGLKDTLNSPESEEYKKQFSRVCTTNLSASLINHLQEPVPPGIEDSAHMIIELAVSIASNMPLESRDINIILPLPGDLLQPYIMKVEAGIPPLDNPGADPSADVDGSSTGSGDKDDSSKDDRADSKLRKDKPKQGMLAGLMGGSSSGSGSKKNSTQTPETSNDAKSKLPADDGTQKVRFAGFVGVEVRGRQILSKAPVWTVG